jgi:beta-glucosidase
VAFARVTVKAGQSQTVRLRFKASALGETAGDIDASAPPTVQPGNYLLQLNKNTTTPYDVDLSQPFTVN